MPPQPYSIALAGELREDLQHIGLHEAGDVGRLCGRVALAAAEQHAVVGGDAVIADHELGVAGAGAAGDQRLRLGLGHRLGGDHEIGDRHDLAGDPGLQPAEIGVAAEHGMVRLDPAGLGRDRDLGAVVVDLGRRAVLEHLHAGRLRRLGEAQRVVQRMQMPAAAILDAAEIEVAGDLALIALRSSSFALV